MEVGIDIYGWHGIKFRIQRFVREGKRQGSKNDTNGKAYLSRRGKIACKSKGDDNSETKNSRKQVVCMLGWAITPWIKATES